MKTLIILLFIIFLTGVEALPQEQQPVPYTLADRDRLIKVETEIGSIRNEINSLRNEMNSLRGEMNSIRSEMNSLRNEMNAKFESIDKQFVYQQKQIDDLKTLYYWGFGNYYYSSCFYDGIHDMVSTYSLETSPNKC
jgi:peptidoglycan hydrolase CwlO-like protein